MVTVKENKIEILKFVSISLIAIPVIIVFEVGYFKSMFYGQFPSRPKP